MKVLISRFDVLGFACRSPSLALLKIIQRLTDSMSKTFVISPFGAKVRRRTLSVNLLRYANASIAWSLKRVFGFYPDCVNLFRCVDVLNRKPAGEFVSKRIGLAKERFTMIFGIGRLGVIRRLTFFTGPVYSKGHQAEYGAQQKGT